MSAALAEPETGWTAGGYHGFSLDRGTWPAISGTGNVLARATPRSWTGRSGRTGRRCSERIGTARRRAGEPFRLGRATAARPGRCPVARSSSFSARQSRLADSALTAEDERCGH
jgi:hypothetical protein